MNNEPHQADKAIELPPIETEENQPNGFSQVFAEWCEDFHNSDYINDLVDRAEEKIKQLDEIEIDYREINVILAQYTVQENIHQAGFFLSTAHELMDQSRIVYDVQTVMKLRGIASEIEKEKYIVEGDTQSWTGGHFEGMLFNYGDCEGSLCCESDSLAINYGKSNMFGEGGPGVYINFGQVGSFYNDRIRRDIEQGLFINFGDVNHMVKGEPKEAAISLRQLDLEDTENSNYLTKQEVEENQDLKGYLQHLEKNLSRENSQDEIENFLDQMEPDPKRRIGREVSEYL